MLDWALGFLLPSIAGLGSLGLAAVVWRYVPGVGRELAIALVAGGAMFILYGVAYDSGYSDRAKACTEDALRAELKRADARLHLLREEVKRATQIQELQLQNVAEARAEADKMKAIADELMRKAAEAPPAPPSCRPSDADLRRLRQIRIQRPRGAAQAAPAGG
jgi:hypothetical protein